MPTELYIHQLTAIDKLANGKVLVGGVGTGKTLVALVYYYTKVLGGIEDDHTSIRRDIPLYVFTTARKRDELDWQHEAAKMGLYDLITVDSYNNIDKYIGVKDAFIVLDEQRMVGSGSWTKAFIKMAKNNQWIMLTATPGDRWEDYIPLFIANGFYKNRTAFKREHIVYSHFGPFPKVERYLGTYKLRRLQESVLVIMPFEKHTKRHMTVITVDHDKELFHKVVKDRWNIYEERPLKDVGELFLVMRRLANSDLSRIKALKSLIQKHPKLIVYYSFDYELQILRSFANSTTLNVSEWNGHKHEPIPETDSWLYLVQYTAGAEAWNCTSTNAICFYSLTYSYKLFEQSMGRIDRLDTPFVDLYYYMLVSKSIIDTAVMKSLRQKKSFNEKNWR